MFFRGSQKYKNQKKYSISLPGCKSFRRKSAPRIFDIGSPERTAFCISQPWKQGSLTVEAAFALPLFFLTVLSLISLMGIYASYAQTMVSLQERAEEQALLQLYRSEESSVPIRLSETVTKELRLLPFDAGILKARVSASVLPWTGRQEYTALSASHSSGGRLYYLSDYRSVYHTSSGCSYLSLQILAVDGGQIGHRRNEHGEGYDACERCVGAGGTAGVVYVTEHGEHYHNAADCSGLKRSVHLVEESDIAGLSLCSRCARREADL